MSIHRLYFDERAGFKKPLEEIHRMASSSLVTETALATAAARRRMDITPSDAASRFAVTLVLVWSSSE